MPRLENVLKLLQAMILEQKAIHLQQFVHALFHGSQRQPKHCSIVVLENLLTFTCQFVVVNFQWQFKLLSMKVFHLVYAFVLFFRTMEARLVVSMVPLYLRGANQTRVTTSVVNAWR